MRVNEEERTNNAHLAAQGSVVPARGRRMFGTSWTR